MYKRQPLQYVLGRAWFMGLPFVVDGRALIPRQDTELLCEAALEQDVYKRQEFVLDQRVIHDEDLAHGVHS